MGNFEKLGILVIIILVVVIMVLSIWGGPVPPAEPLPYENSLNLSSAGIGDSATPPEQPPAREPPAEEEDLPDFAPPERGGEGTEPPTEDRPAEPPAARPPEDLVHVVTKGDSFFSLARHYYGDGKYYREIRDANPAVDPTKMQLGLKLTIPHPDRVKGGGTREAARNDRSEESAPAAAPGFYVVQKNDSLAKISRKVLGTEARWKSIWEANRDKIGDDPTRIQPGWRLRIPR